MHMQAVQPTGLIQYLIPLVVFAIIFAYRARRMSQMRPLKLEQLWVAPAIYLVVVTLSLWARPPHVAGWVAGLVGVLVGAAVGWWRAKTITIHLDPATHTLNQKASPLGMLVLLVLVGAKVAANAGGRAAHLDVAVLTDGALGLALGTFTAMRIEMYLRGRRLLEAARAR